MPIIPKHKNSFLWRCTSPVVVCPGYEDEFHYKVQFDAKYVLDSCKLVSLTYAATICFNIIVSFE